jgi:hypothetical protein
MTNRVSYTLAGKIQAAAAATKAKSVAAAAAAAPEVADVALSNSVDLKDLYKLQKEEYDAGALPTLLAA